jgi:hypothetical protein
MIVAFIDHSGPGLAAAADFAAPPHACAAPTEAAHAKSATAV